MKKSLCIVVMTCFILTSGFAQETGFFGQDTLNHWLTYGIPGKTVLDSLGQPDVKGEFEYWESDANYHQSWEYTSLGLTLWIVSDSYHTIFIVESIFLTDNPWFSTTKGIRIGTPKEQVLNLYDAQSKNPYEDGVFYVNSNLLIIGNVLKSTLFRFTDDKVSMIVIGGGFGE